MAATKKNPKLNVRLLRRIQKHILEEPRRFFMEDVVLKASNQQDWSYAVAIYGDAPRLMPPCGTAACIAGWANLLTGAKDSSDYLSYHRAVEHLGLTEESPLADGWFDKSTLFLATLWPEPFARRYEKAKTPKTRAKIAAARIEHLIKTGE